MVNSDYSDIINKSRPDSLRHRKMSNYERAAQFSPLQHLQAMRMLFQRWQGLQTVR